MCTSLLGGSLGPSSWMECSLTSDCLSKIAEESTKMADFATNNGQTGAWVVEGVVVVLREGHFWTATMHSLPIDKWNCGKKWWKTVGKQWENSPKWAENSQKMVKNCAKMCAGHAQKYVGFHIEASQSTQILHIKECKTFHM